MGRIFILKSHDNHKIMKGVYWYEDEGILEFELRLDYMNYLRL